MKRKIKTIIKHFKVHKFEYLNKILNRMLIVVSVIIIVLILKKINNSNTNMVLEKLHENITCQFNIKDQGDKVFKKTEVMIHNSSKYIETFNERLEERLEYR